MKLICVIDDDPAHRKMLEQNLTSQNYQVLLFSSGKDFLTHSHNQQPFAIILDHYLKEDKTGLDYLIDIKKKMPKVPVIYMTNETDADLIKQIKSSKASGYIAKDMASLVRLRTILDELGVKAESSWFSKIFK